MITLWTASWCPSCKIVTPLVRELIEKEGAGENKGGVGFAEVEFDSPTLGEVAGRYMVSGPEQKDVWLSLQTLTRNLVIDHEHSNATCIQSRGGSVANSADERERDEG